MKTEEEILAEYAEEGSLFPPVYDGDVDAIYRAMGAYAEQFTKNSFSLEQIEAKLKTSKLGIHIPELMRHFKSSR